MAKRLVGLLASFALIVLVACGAKQAAKIGSLVLKVVQKPALQRLGQSLRIEP